MAALARGGVARVVEVDERDVRVPRARRYGHARGRGGRRYLEALAPRAELERGEDVRLVIRNPPARLVPVNSAWASPVAPYVGSPLRGGRRDGDVGLSAAERRIRPHVIETPAVRSGPLSARSGAEVYLKLENLQETGSFKPRGATHKLLSLTPAQAARGVVAASSGGNHALAVAAAAARLGIAAEVFVPSAIDPAQREKMSGSERR